MAVRRFDTVHLDGSRAHRRDSDGALIVPGRFARSGLQTYRQSDGSEIVELRPPEAVRASAGLFSDITITDRHPPDFVNPGNWDSVARGHMSAPRVIEPATDVDDLWLESDLVINHGSLADAIERGDRSELSAGYLCEEIDSPGEFRGKAYHRVQDAILPNHVAALGPGEARAGRGARMMLDSAGHQMVDEKESSMTDEEIAKLTAERDQLQARADALVAERDGLKAKIAEIEDPSRLDALVTARTELVQQARKIAGEKIDTTGTDVEIRRRALEAVGRKIAGKSDAYIEAAFDLALEATPAQTVADVVDTIGASGDTETQSEMQALYDAYDAAQEVN